MNRLFKGIVTNTVLLGTVFSIAASCDTNSPTLKYFNRRSDSRHKYIQMVSLVDKTHLGDAESMYGVFTATPGYRNSMRPKAIAETLFGDHITNEKNCSGNIIKIAGSEICDRDDKTWLADYFYLPRNYKGHIKIKPEIKTFFLDLDLFVGLDEWLCGAYFRIWGDLVHTSWKLGLCEVNDTDFPYHNHPEGYFTPLAYEAENLVQSFELYAAGKMPAQSNPSQAVKDIVLGDEPLPGNGVGIENSNTKFQSLNYARMTKCSHTKTGFADLRAELGWDFWQSNCYHLGLNIQMAAPTGGTQNAKYLFDAIVGNGNHWEVGGGLTGHYNLWTSENNEQTLSFHVDANITHLFKASVERTFDLKNKPNSAYMLAAKFGPNPVADPRTAADDQVGYSDGNPAAFVATAKQFAGVYAPVANLSTTTVDISVGVQADIVAMFNYTCGPISFDLGYNYFGQSCEKIDCAEGTCNNTQSLANKSQEGTWGLKGDARMFGYNPDDDVSGVGAIPLSATQSQATITSGTNKQCVMQYLDGLDLATPAPVLNPAAGIAEDNNMSIDNSSAAFVFDLTTPLYPIPYGPGGQPGINTSKTAILLKKSDLDFTRAKANSHTVFSNVSYTFDRECWVPHIGVGFAAEFGSNGTSCDDDLSNDTTCTTNGACVNAALSQWSIWLQGGVSFN